ncbi:GNAT family N-acetyltransferase [Kutzneria sp. NPDC052558]|uniref:GNAT family N-acetyltransferase n=1 Tax=Kutzneria sp. NPDC052558 TaxID=3364121 RepID=UPI0037C9C5A3
MTIRTPLFCGTALAQRIERVEAQLVAQASAAARARRADTLGFAREIAGGVASYAEADSPFNKIAGLGFGGVPTEAELVEVEQAFRTLGSPVPVELANLADPAVGELLTGRGYRLTGYENVLGLSLDGLSAPEPPPGVEVRLCRADETDTALDLLVEAVLNPDTEGVASAEDFPRDVLGNAIRDMDSTGTRRYLALIDDVPVGTGSLRIADGTAYFAGAATSVQHRRRGVQTALIATRLADAIAAGCDIATVTTAPGTKSQQNVQRRGFDLLYTRALLQSS